MNALGIAAVIGAAFFVDYNYRQIQKQPKIFVREALPNNLNAMCFPPFGIFVTEEQKDNDNLLEHELVHWVQYQRMGLIPFYLQYVGECVFYGYDHSPMEIEARFNECEYCRLNYSECVRNGMAATVFNPNFR